MATAAAKKSKKQESRKQRKADRCWYNQWLQKWRDS